MWTRNIATVLRRIARTSGPYGALLAASSLGRTALADAGPAPPSAAVPSEAAARAVCLASGRSDCDRVADRFRPLPAPDRAPALEAACQAGDGVACFDRGRGLPLDASRPWLERACALAHDAACQDLYATGGGPDPAWVARRIRDGEARCAAGRGDGCDDAALFLTVAKLRLDAPDADARIAALQTRGCELGHGPACYSAALAAFRIGCDAARPLMERGCELGNPNACEDLKGFAALCRDLTPKRRR